jgi:DNA-binding MarR family transcriptional regulator
MRRPPSLDEDAPLAPILLRMAALAATSSRSQWVEEAGFDVTPAHATVLESLWDYPSGARLSTLAKLSRITKPSMTSLIDELERRGYVERTLDPEDARATRVRFTSKGADFTRRVRAREHELEQAWEEVIGTARVSELKSTLLALCAFHEKS